MKTIELCMAAVLSLGATPCFADDAAKPATAGADMTHYKKLETKNYTLELPEGWEAGQETPFGQREITPSKDLSVARGYSMSSMTGPGLGARSWEDLYNTSLFFITRYDRGGGGEIKATRYKLGKSPLGYETCSWSMNDTSGKAVQKFVILKSTTGNILALSIKLPASGSKDTNEKNELLFNHIVQTAIVR